MSQRRQSAAQLPQVHPDTHAIDGLESRALDLFNENQPLAALSALEQSLAIRFRVHGPYREDTIRAYEHFVQQCNSQAMQYLREGDTKICAELLRLAQASTEPERSAGSEALRLRLRAVTLNNLGCLYKRLNRPEQALECLERALHYEVGADVPMDNPASTHLNICAVLSQLGRHQDALQHVLCALQQLQQQVSAPGHSTSSTELGSMAVAFHNLGVEQEFLLDRESAAESYRRAVELAERAFGPDHSMTQTLRQSWRSAQLALLSRPVLPERLQRAAAHNKSPGRSTPLSAVSPYSRSARPGARTAQRPPSPSAPRQSPGPRPRPHSSAGRPSVVTPLPLHTIAAAGAGSQYTAPSVAAGPPHRPTRPASAGAAPSAAASSPPPVRPASSAGLVNWTLAVPSSHAAPVARGRTAAELLSVREVHPYTQVRLPARSTMPPAPSLKPSSSPDQHPKGVLATELVFSHTGGATAVSAPASLSPSLVELAADLATAERVARALEADSVATDSATASNVGAAISVDRSAGGAPAPLPVSPYRGGPPAVRSRIAGAGLPGVGARLPLEPEAGADGDTTTATEGDSGPPIRTSSPVAGDSGLGGGGGGGAPARPESTSLVSGSPPAEGTAAPWATPPSSELRSPDGSRPAFSVSPVALSSFHDPGPPAPSGPAAAAPSMTNSSGAGDRDTGEGAHASALSDPGGTETDLLEGGESALDADVEGQPVRLATSQLLQRSEASSPGAQRPRHSLRSLSDVVRELLAQKNDMSFEERQFKRSSEAARSVATAMLERVRSRLRLALPGSSTSASADAAFGKLYAWGANEHGQLGLGHTECNKTLWLPRPVAALAHETIISVACGAEHVLAVTSYAHCPRGVFPRVQPVSPLMPNTEQAIIGCLPGGITRTGLGHSNSTHTPTEVPLPHALQVACGTEHSLAIDKSGALYATGRNDDGQLGLGHRMSPVSSFTRVEALRHHVITTAAAGERHSMAVTRSGVLFTWGSGEDGRLGHGGTEDRVLPTEIVVVEGKTVHAVAAGCDHSLALTSTGDVYVWGSDRMEQLGLGTGVRQLSGLKQLAPRAVKSIRTHTAVEASCGYAHCFVLTADDNTPFVWGLGSSGQLGLGSTNSAPTPTELTEPRGMRSVACGLCHTAAIVGDGQVWTWGWGKDGRLGHGDDKDVLRPRRVSALVEPCMRVVCGAEFTVAITGPPSNVPSIQPSKTDPAIEPGRGRLSLGGRALFSTPIGLSEARRMQQVQSRSPVSETLFDSSLSTARS